MRLRAYVAAASIAAGLWLSTGSARAQGAAPAPPPAGQAPDIVGVEKFFSAPSALGDAWQRAVHAVLDGMRDLLQADKAAAQQALAPAATPKPRAPAWQLIPPARRETLHRPVVLHPVAFEPALRAGDDGRGERATLLGVRAELPWLVP
jgi:hypothetical protein